MKKKLILLSLACLAFTGGYGAIAEAYPAGGLWGRAEFRGYFHNTADGYGTQVWPSSGGKAGCASSGGNAIPTYINTVDEFVAFVRCKLGGSTQEKVGASFIIFTMTSPMSAPIRSPVPPTAPTAAQVDDWESDVRYYNTLGRIRWGLSFGAGTFDYNSYYQATNGTGPCCQANPIDDAFYDWSAATGPTISFVNASGQVTYAIKHECANPIGIVSLFSPLQDDPKFNMSGTSTVDNLSDGAGPVTNTNVVPGQTVQFAHSLTSNTAATGSLSINWTTQDTENGNSTVATGNAGTFTAGQTKTGAAIGAGGVQSYLVPLGTLPGTQICRRISFTPDTSAGGSDVSAEACATVTGDFNLNPAVTIQVNGVDSTDNIAQPGDSVTFTYKVNNSDDGDSGSTSCTIYGLTRTGYYTIPNPYDTTSDASFIQPPHGCPRNFPANTNTTLLAAPGTETILAGEVIANRSICRSLFVNPASPGGGAVGDEKCVYVAGKPYARVYGGDISAGGGFATVAAPNDCSFNGAAAVIGWNKGSAGSYAGAGVQYAAYALSSIFDAATALGNSGGAIAPTGLAFGNTVTNPANGLFGGSFGSAPCISDYYGSRPASTLGLPPDPTITNMVTGVYGANSGAGNVYFGASGVISTGERITVYVDDDVYINTNIIYSSGWSTGTMPLFKLIARGNIYVDYNVNQLDGLFVAQKKVDGTGGTIYTCSTTLPSQGPVLPTNANFNSWCDNQKLTVNGAFVANQVQLGRTQGTLSQSLPGHTGVTGFAAEVFNYSPALWIAQPSQSSGTADYDAITSLPPIL